MLALKKIEGPKREGISAPAQLRAQVLKMLLMSVAHKRSFRIPSMQKCIAFYALYSISLMSAHNTFRDISSYANECFYRYEKGIYPELCYFVTSACWTYPQQMTDRINQIRPVQRVEMEIMHSVGNKPLHLFGGNGRSNQMRCFHIVLKPLKTTRNG